MLSWTCTLFSWTTPPWYHPPSISGDQDAMPVQHSWPWVWLLMIMILPEKRHRSSLYWWTMNYTASKQIYIVTSLPWIAGYFSKFSNFFLFLVLHRLGFTHQNAYYSSCNPLGARPIRQLSRMSWCGRFWEVHGRLGRNCRRSFRVIGAWRPLATRLCSLRGTIWF